jgi:hypothetical protein
MVHLGTMMLARHRWIERREDAVRILAVNPDVAVEVRLEVVRVRLGSIQVVAAGLLFAALKLT